MKRPYIGDEVRMFICDDGNEVSLQGRIATKAYCTTTCGFITQKLAECVQVKLRVVDVKVDQREAEWESGHRDDKT